MSLTLNTILQIKDKLKCSFTYSEGNTYLITRPSKKNVPDVPGKTAQRCCICSWKNSWGLDSKWLPADTSALCISGPVPEGHGYLRDVDSKGICWRCRWGAHGEEGSGEFLYDALMAEQPQGPFRRPEKPGPAWW